MNKYYQKASQHRDFVNGDIAKTGDKSSLHCQFKLENLSCACHFASVHAVMSLLKLFQVQGKDPKCESVKTSDYVVDLTCILGLLYTSRGTSHFLNRTRIFYQESSPGQLAGK